MIFFREIDVTDYSPDDAGSVRCKRCHQYFKATMLEKGESAYIYFTEETFELTFLNSPFHQPYISFFNVRPKDLANLRSDKERKSRTNP